MRGLWLLLMLPLTLSTASAGTLRIQPQRTALDGSYLYYTDLLRLVLQVTEPEYGPADLQTISTRLSQSRAFQALADHQIDVFWAGTNREREQQSAAIRVPLYGGLLGYRIPVIRRSDQARFDQLQTRQQLQALTACQGDQWPDSDILQANGFQVLRVTKFEVMYNMLRAGRCDYFPRGLNEVYAEVAHVSRQDLMAYERIILAYPFPMYFFVAQDNETLNNRLQKGMEQLVASGELRHFMQQHATTRAVFPLSRFNNSWILHLENPGLPAATPLNDGLLWWRLQ